MTALRSTRTRRSARRLTVATAAVAALLLLSCCASTSSSASEKPASETLPTGTPSDGTSLRIAGRLTQLQLEAAGSAIDPLDFTVKEWVNVGAGPDVIQAFRAGALDVANNAIIPPIQAHDIGFDATIVAVLERPAPSYIFATAAGVDLDSFTDLKGKKIAFSQGQSQGDTVLRTLRTAGIDTDDVELIALPSTQFLTALQGGQVDVAPLSEPEVTKYIDQYGRDGAVALPAEEPDLLSILWVPTKVLADDDSVLAVRDYIRAWAQGQVWAWENSDEWKKYYFVDTEGLTSTDADRIWALANKPSFPTDWDTAVDWAQSSIELLAGEGYVKEFDAETLFDRRFEGDAAAAVAAEYVKEK